LDKSFNIPTAGSIDGESVYSTTARKNLFFPLILFSGYMLNILSSKVDERLLDVSVPTLLDQTFPIEPFHDDDDPRSVPPTTSVGDDFDQACQRILVLEAELEKSNNTVTKSLQELSNEKQRCLDLESRIEELELALKLERSKVCDRCHEKEKDAKSGLDDGNYEKMLEMAKKERDDALDLVREIRKLMVKS
jgi:hypothetical protein